jgi:sec-independent protein translocase protein TatA
MNFFGIGLGELLFIIIIVLILFGPGKIVEISRQLGRAVNAFRRASSHLTSQITKEMENEERNKPTQSKTNEKDD